MASHLAVVVVASEFRGSVERRSVSCSLFSLLPLPPLEELLNSGIKHVCESLYTCFTLLAQLISLFPPDLSPLSRLARWSLTSLLNSCDPSSATFHTPIIEIFHTPVISPAAALPRKPSSRSLDLCSTSRIPTGHLLKVSLLKFSSSSSLASAIKIASKTCNPSP